MNVIGQIDPSAFAAAQRLHHREDEPTLEFPSSAGSRRRNLLALRAQNWRASGGKPTPWDYRIEYCESDGTQAVGLTIIPSVGIQIVMDFVPVKLDGNAMFGVTVRGSYLQVRAMNKAFAMYCTGATSPVSGSKLVAGSRHSLVFGPSAYTIDGESNGGSFGSTAPNGEILLFAMNSGIPYYKSSLRVYEFSANYNGVDVIRLVPCVKDGVVGFWDLVSEQFLTDTYGGTLIAGPRI